MTGDLNRTVVQPAAERATAGRHRWIVVCAGIFALSMAGLGLILFSQHGQITALQAAGAQRDTTNATLAKDVSALAEQVKRLGGTPVVQAPPTAPAHVDAADLREAARQAVADYCAPRNQCRGADGTSPNFDDIVTAVVNLIPRPANGADGKQGPGPTDEQVSTAVADYCDAHNQCVGPPGSTGAPGPAGPAGATGPAGAPGPTCPDGYELRDAVITAPDGTHYQGKACVDPDSGTEPAKPPTIGG